MVNKSLRELKTDTKHLGPDSNVGMKDLTNRGSNGKAGFGSFKMGSRVYKQLDINTTTSSDLSKTPLLQQLFPSLATDSRVDYQSCCCNVGFFHV